MITMRGSRTQSTSTFLYGRAFTESSEQTRAKAPVSAGCDIVNGGRQWKVNIITGKTAQSSDTFKVNFPARNRPRVHSRTRFGSIALAC